MPNPQDYFLRRVTDLISHTPPSTNEWSFGVKKSCSLMALLEKIFQTEQKYRCPVRISTCQYLTRAGNLKETASEMIYICLREREEKKKKIKLLFRLKKQRNLTTSSGNSNSGVMKDFIVLSLLFIIKFI